jgi:hypothetical protein
MRADRMRERERESRVGGSDRVRIGMKGKGKREELVRRLQMTAVLARTCCASGAEQRAS